MILCDVDSRENAQEHMKCAKNKRSIRRLLRERKEERGQFNVEDIDDDNDKRIPSTPKNLRSGLSNEQETSETFTIASNMSTVLIVNM